MNTELSPTTTVGCIGLGIMGLPAAKNMRNAGWPLAVYARRPQTAAALADASVFSSPQQLAADCRVVVLNVSDTPDVEEITLGDKGLIHGLQKGAIVIDMSTIAPAAARRIAHAMAQKGAYFLDAPVSGGQQGAIDGTLTIMVGGDQAAFSQALPLLQAMGKTITHIGDSGAGQVAKACNQIIIGATIEGVAEAFALAEKNGVSPAAVRQALLGGFAASRVLENHGQRMLDGNFAPGFKTILHHKDMKIALANGGENNLSLPSAELFLSRLRDLIKCGDENLDSSAIYQVIADKTTD